MQFCSKYCSVIEKIRKFETDGSWLRIYKKNGSIEIYSNSERSEQFLKENNLSTCSLLEVSTDPIH